MKIIYFEANSCFISQTCEKRVFGQRQDLSHFPCVLPVIAVSAVDDHTFQFIRKKGG